MSAQTKLWAVVALVCIAVLVVVLCNTGCSSVIVGRTFDYNHTYKVTVWSGSQAVKTYTTQDSPQSEDHSDGWYFTDKATGKLVLIAGTITCEQAD